MKSNYELISLIQVINGLNIEKGTKKELKIKKILDYLKPFIDDYNDKYENIRLEYAHTDSNGLLELNEKGDYRYTKDSLREMSKEMKDLMNSTFNFQLIDIGKDGIEDLVFLEDWIK
jgi:hypothetical protein